MPVSWEQHYDPLGSALGSTLFAGLPILVLLGALASGVSALRSASLGLAVALAIALFGYAMPADLALAAAGNGAAYGLFPIGWIVFGAVYLYRLTVSAGLFETVTYQLSAMAGRQLPFFALLVPFWMIWLLAGFRGMLGCWPAILVGGGSFGTIQFLLSNFHGPSLVDVAGGIGSLACLAVFLKFWKPKTIWRFAEDEPVAAASPAIPRGKLFRAWLPWLLLTVCVFAWGTRPVKDFLKSLAGGERPVPRLHQAVVRTPPVAAYPLPEKAVYEFYPLAATGTGILVAAALTCLLVRIPPGVAVKELGATLKALLPALGTISTMMALAFLTKYCGSDATLGLAFTRAGWLYPFFAPLLGWLGVALTGSDTSSNALFGGLQKITAEKLDLPVILIAASNSTGGVMGKMIDAQSIVVAAVATGREGQEGTLLRFVLPHSIALASLVGLLTLLQAYVLPWMIPP
ncbi:MAG TPA: L-lactate permease [Planctomycetia bacterium]|nr:L-lactate permease [Planctomycetia bacterium]